MPRAMAAVEPSLTADEMAWLATLPDVESRLVFTDRDNNEQSYRVAYGPFSESCLASLPDRDWTLLLQDVEKHLPDFRKLFSAVDFVPDWRIDDLMVSVAAPGGSAGPHSDNYDVFLCQGTGRRSWRLADAGIAEIDPESPELSLLRPFEGDQKHSAAENDVLYLPPGVPHWGVADELCITYSIGMRAPNMAELRAGSERLFPGETIFDDELPGTDSQHFYRDPDLTPDEASPGLIAPKALQRLRDQRLLPKGLDDEQIAIVFGSVATDPKAWLAPDCMSKKDAEEWLSGLSGSVGLGVHGMARLAFCEPDRTAHFFANGFWRTVSDTQRALIRKTLAQRQIDNAELAIAMSHPGSMEIIEWMTMHGVFDTTR